MQLVTRKELRRLIEEARAAGKDATGLEQMLKSEATSPIMGEVRRVGDHLIVSTGPARREDFE